MLLKRFLAINTPVQESMKNICIFLILISVFPCSLFIELAGRQVFGYVFKYLARADIIKKTVQNGKVSRVSYLVAGRPFSKSCKSGY